MTVRNRREKKKGKKGGRPESSEKLERGTELESEPGGEVGLGEQRQASTVDLVVPEHLQHDCDVDVVSEHLHLDVKSSSQWQQYGDKY